MSGSLIEIALEITRNATLEQFGATHRQAKLYLEATAAMARTQADFLDALAAESTRTGGEHVPGPKSLTFQEVKAVWDGVNEQARRILGAFAVYGGAMTVQDLMRVVGAEEPRLLNGPLGGISRRVKKLLGDPEATFYSVDPDDNRYILPTVTFNALCDLIEQERPQWLTQQFRNQGALGNTAAEEGQNHE